MEREWIVYLHINSYNNKTYVGITHYCENPNKRWRKGKGYRKNPIFSRAIVKYGWDNFKHIILCKTSKTKACLLESTLISLYKNKSLSYNIGLGGEGSSSFSEETKDKLRQYVPWIKGKHHTEETKEKIRLAGFSRTLSEESKEKISKANKGKRNGMFGKEVPLKIRQELSKRFSKPVLQFSIQGEFINEYKSATEAEKILNVKGNHISCCCLGKRKTAYGYKWKYKDD